MGVTAYRRAHRRLQRETPGKEYSRSYYRALRALAKRYPYEFALLLEDIRSNERRGENHDATGERAEPA